MRSVGSFLKDAYRLAKPYFARSDERLFAWGMLIAIIVLNLTMVGMSVILNFWHREFYNAIQTKNWQAFLELLFMYRRTPSGLMPGFVELATIWIAIAVYAVYLNQWLQIRWRNWMTREFLAEWLSDRAYYHISLATDTAAVGTDNPDQRIAEDLRDFTRSTLSLGLSLLSNLVSLFSFLTILWSLSGSTTVFGINIPGYMVWVALIYSVLGTCLTHLVGRPLAALNFRQQRVEADFRYALVRVRENVEGIALYHGEKEEQELLYERFSSVIGNWWAIMRRLRWLNALIAGYSQLASIFPIVVAAPRYFFGTMELGDLMQTVGAFGQVQGAMSWIIDQYSANNPNEVSLVRWRSIVERLSTFDRAVVVARATAEKISVNDSPDGSVQLRDFTISLPDGAKLLSDADVVLEPGHSVVISGRSGSGKSTLFRAIAGIWPFGEGRVQAGARRPASVSATSSRIRILPRPTPSRRSRTPWRRWDSKRWCPGWTRTNFGRSSFPVASNNASRWHGRCWRNRTGCSLMRRPRAWIRRRSRSSTACCARSCHTPRWYPSRIVRRWPRSTIATWNSAVPRGRSARWNRLRWRPRAAAGGEHWRINPAYIRLIRGTGFVL